MKISHPYLALVTSTNLFPRLQQSLEVIGQALNGGVNIVIVREAGLPASSRLKFARELRSMTSGRALLLINGDLDCAIEANADGIQLAESVNRSAGSIRVEASPRSLLVGRSIHSVKAARRAGSEGADLLLAGNVFTTPSHPCLPGRGIPFLQEITSATHLPTIAIGGINPENAASVMRAGAAGVAMQSGFLRAQDALAIAVETIRAIRDV